MLPSAILSALATFIGAPGLVRRLASLASRTRDLVGLRDPQQHADHPHRHHRREFGDDVEAVRTDMRVKAIDAEPPDLVLDLGHPARREHPAISPRSMVCTGGSSNIITPLGMSKSGLDEFEDVAAGVGERLPVRRAPSRRRRAARSPRSRSARCGRAALPRAAGIRRLWVGGDVEVVRVVVNDGVVGDRHGLLYFRRLPASTGSVTPVM